MTQSTLEKQEAKLKQLNKKIKAEKSKIEQNIGKQIIKNVFRIFSRVFAGRLS